MNDVTCTEAILDNDPINSDIKKPRYLISFVFRLGAYLIDFFVTFTFLSIMTSFEPESEPGSDSVGIFLLLFLIGLIFHGIYHVVFLYRKSATPGKMLVSQQVRDFNTGSAPTLKQCIGRLFAAYLSMLLCGIGCFWVVFDKNRRALHDYLAGTVVISDDTYIPGEDDRPYVAPKDVA